MIKIVFFDLSKTVMKNGPADVIAAHLGVSNIRKEICKLREDGKISKWEQGTKSSICYKGFNLEDVDKIKEKFVLNENIKECLDQLHEQGIKTVLITNSCKQVAEKICKMFKLPFDLVKGSVIEEKNGALTGKIVEYPLQKNDAVKEVLKELNLRKDDAAAIGDSLGDIPMFDECKIGVLYNPEEKAKGKADYEIKEFMELVQIIDKYNKYT